MFNTQQSSKPRLQNDTLGEDALKDLYTYYAANDTVDQFKEKCVALVQAGGGKQPRKDEIIRAINMTPNRSVALKKTQDFILAGMGLGV